MKTRQEKKRPDFPKPSRQSGAAAVEMAIVIILMLPIVAAIVEFGRTFWYADALTKATRDGARLLSTWPAATIQSGGVAAARTLVRTASDAANVSPALTDGEISVECLDNAFAVAVCADGTAPANVRVTITDFTVSLGGWMPFVRLSAGSYVGGDAPLAPHTTMRYMNLGLP